MFSREARFIRTFIIDENDAASRGQWSEFNALTIVAEDDEYVWIKNVSDFPEEAGIHRFEKEDYREDWADWQRLTRESAQHRLTENKDVELPF